MCEKVSTQQIEELEARFDTVYVALVEKIEKIRKSGYPEYPVISVCVISGDGGKSGLVVSSDGSFSGKMDMLGMRGYLLSGGLPVFVEAYALFMDLGYQEILIRDDNEQELQQYLQDNNVRLLTEFVSKLEEYAASF
ncbi:hypothetical protein A2382_00200 [Candidatus Woesebacteria bacterium RIFOXYB1_FULL_38_16]|uniref:Uncharacterized protein n=1 Tax=Candidatus Woesebacteria bacterium RIFOXYB1_FULL_38_16 TaxID=1802538 RepID=A0A1F8CV39_9BACT|nr:MAG: hypothetical protein A2191_00870 [Candidatus Woesebacteria bacterium RIFOXYA1_FULL_38_9]OGM80190.1 MAG: hypothetical protein A2382_00200 [Candidatus Woesebacteria bacterium RIFOXYB1_FULL_38_16]